MSTFRQTRKTACLGLLAFALFAPSANAADDCAAPPGTSGIDQYCEALPTPGGTNGSHHGGGGNGGGHHASPVSTKTVATLKHEGDAGAAVLALTRSAPTTVTPKPTPKPKQGSTHRTHKSQGSGGSSQATTTTPTTQQPVNAGPPAQAAPASNPASAVGNSFGGSLGAGFFVLLAGLGIVMAFLAWLDRRRRRFDDGAETA
ncbi:MAG TPA: hypothetical protein VGI67_19450 [Thermoleophilaceae bacterium]